MKSVQAPASLSVRDALFQIIEVSDSKPLLRQLRSRLQLSASQSRESFEA